MSGVAGGFAAKPGKSGASLIGVLSDNLLTASAAIGPDFGLRHGGREVTRMAERSGT
jgi:hypothetical protein